MITMKTTKNRAITVTKLIYCLSASPIELK